MANLIIRLQVDPATKKKNVTITYENGPRRDVSAIGLEILAKKDQLPAPSAELTQVSNPGS